MATERRVSTAISVYGAVTLFDHILRIPRLTTSSSTIFVQPVAQCAGQVHFGGCGANQAAAVARLGCGVELVGVVGEDFLTTGYSQRLTEVGVDLSELVVVKGATSGHSYIIHADDGETLLVVEEGAATQENTRVSALEFASASRLLVLNMPFDILALSLGRVAAARGCKVLLSGQIGTADVAIRDELLRLASYICCNRAEAVSIGLIASSGGGLERFPWLESAWVTDGARGICNLGGDGRVVEVPSVSEIDVVDPTGAGDGIVAGVALSLVSGAGALEATRSGAVVASFVVEAVGCQEALPTWDRFVARYEATYGAAPSWEPSGGR